MAEYARPGLLVSTQWVADRLKDPKIRVIEVSVDAAAFDQGHIPGAVALNWFHDLEERPHRDIASKATMERLLGNAGVGPDSIIVVYGDNNNWFATYAYWLFRLYGHRDVRVMNGGRKKWMDEGRPMTKEAATYPKVQYEAKQPDTSIRAMRDTVLQSLPNAGKGLVDVRSPREFSGELLAPENLPQEGAQRGGHVP
ncbi:MAG: sulfurtransferase, partial [Candidatus Methylomirabilales bacterium]